MSRKIFQVYLEPNNVTSEEANKVLDRLNSLNSAAEIINVIGNNAGQRVIGIRIAQRILNTKMRAGKFKDLNEVATVPGIGYKRFTTIMSILSHQI